MMAKVKAIVLGGVNIKEKDRLINVFTLENGKMTLSLKGVRGEKAKLKFAKQTFCFGEFFFEEGKTNIVTAVDVIDSFYDLSSDIEKYYEACSILDIVKQTANEANSLLFIEIIKALKSLCYDNVKKYYVFDKFLLFVLKNMGYDFMTERCSVCGGPLVSKYFNFDVGEIVCAACQNAMCEKISDACMGALRILDKTDYDKLESVTLGAMGEIQAYDLLSKDFKYRTGIEVLKI